MSRVRIAVVVAVALLAVGVVGAYRWWHDRPPYGPDQLQASATLHPTDYGESTALLAPEYSLFPGERDQLIVGEVAWRTPPRDSDGHFAIVLIDKRNNRRPGVMAAKALVGHAAIGGHGVLNQVADRYPWLRGAGDIRDGDVWHSAGVSVFAPPEATGVTFVALFPDIPAGSPERELIAHAPVSASDLLVAMVFLGEDSQIYWAQRLYG